MKRNFILALFILYSLITHSQTRDSLRIFRIDSLINSYIENLKTDTLTKESLYSGNVLENRFFFGKRKIGEFKLNVLFHENSIYVFKKEINYLKANKNIITTYSFENNKLIKYEKFLTINNEEINNLKELKFHKIKMYLENSKIIGKKGEGNIKLEIVDFSEKDIKEMTKIELELAFEIAKYYYTKKGYFLIVDNE